ncbi:MAG TPA: amidohydrolase [Terriglobales bacterium]|nr:amidohydrolase [Terriglobales bacterium]
MVEFHSLFEGASRLALPTVVAIAGLVGTAAAGAQAPDAVYLHGKIMTMDAEQPTAQALALRGERLVAVGTDAAISALAGPQTQRVDLKGRFVLPGFEDAHTHQLAAGTGMLDLDLSNTRSLQELQQRIAAYAKTLPPGEWIIGSRWDHTLWPGQQFPTRQDLDPYTGDHPAFLSRLDGHAAVANSLALGAAGVGRNTPTPSGGEIGKDAAGEPNGLLLEGAQELVRRQIPPMTMAQRRRALTLSMQDALAHGVTSVQDYSDWNTFLTYEQMEKEGALRFRVVEWLTFLEPLATLQAQRAHHDLKDPWLHTGMLKAFMDGSLGSRTAAMLEPYSDDPHNRGIPQYQQAVLNRMAIERARAGFQLGFHAIGDRAVEMALNAFQAVASAVPDPHNPQAALVRHPAVSGPRPRIEHLQVIAPRDIARVKQLGVIGSVQPSHLLDDDRWAEARLGRERARDSYLWQTFLQEGVVLAFGTDDPVEPVNPMLGIYSAVTRTSADGTIHYPPEKEAVTMEQALYAYTMGAAISEFAEDNKGSLTPGKLADFVVLSQDLRAIPAAELLGTRVEMTVVGGKTMYTAPGWEP